MADDRTYIRVHDGLYEHPKVAGLSDAAFRLLIESWCYCSRNHTDGQMADVIWKRRGTPKARRELVEAGLAEQHAGHVEMHDYLEHQRSAEEIRLLREVRGDTGTYGAHVRWHVVKRKPKKDCEHCFPTDGNDGKPIANAIANGWQTDSKPMASTEAEAEAEVKKNSSRGVSHVSSAAPEQPPLYSDRCKRHGNDAEPGPCGNCKDVREANKARPSLSLVPAGVPWPMHCGQCDENRQRETKFGVIRCPECHPLAEEESA